MLSGGNASNISIDSCYKFSSKQFDIAFYAKMCMDSLGIAVCLAVMTVIILSKAYKRFVFRLVIYFIVADIFQAITHIIELTPVEVVNGEVVVKEGADAVCAFYGFLDQLALWMGNVAIIWIMLYLLWLVHGLRKIQKGVRYQNSEISLKTEMLGLFFLLVFPLSFNWIPFVWDMYGISGLWCWIKESRDICHDYDLGLSLIFSMYYGPLMVIVTFTFISLMAITSILCKGAVNKNGVARRTYSRGTRDTVLIAMYPVVYSLICLVAIANRIYSAMNGSKGKEPFFPLWIAQTIAEPARVLIPPIAFLLHPNSWKTMFKLSSSRDYRPTSHTASIHIPREDSDIESSIVIPRSPPRIELYGAIIEVK